MRFFIAEFETRKFTYKSTGLTEEQVVNELGAALLRESITHSADDISVTSWELGRAYRDYTDISEGAPDSAKIKRTMVNWDDADLCGEAGVLEQNKCANIFTATLAFDNQIGIEISSSSGEQCMDMFIEINQGVPSVHISPEIGGDNQLHIYRKPSGLDVLWEDS